MTRTNFRIAFLTPEFVAEMANTGGLASYLERMTKALKAVGHDVVSGRRKHWKEF